MIEILKWIASLSTVILGLILVMFYGMYVLTAVGILCAIVLTMFLTVVLKEAIFGG